MLTILKILLFMILGGIIAGAGIYYPGTLDIEWLGHHVHTSISLVLAGIFALLLASFILIKVLKMVFGFPFKLGNQYRLYDRQRALNSLWEGVVALEQGDPEQALKNLKRALLHEDTQLMATYLAGEWAQKAGKFSEALNYFIDLKNIPSAQAVAFKRLLILYQHQDQPLEALKQVLEIQKSSEDFLKHTTEMPSLASEVLKIYSKLGRVEDMELILKELKSSRTFTKEERKNWEAQVASLKNSKTMLQEINPPEEVFKITSSL